MLIIQLVKSSEEIEKAKEIRRKVFVEEQGVPLEEDLDGKDNECAHYLALWDGVPCAACRVRKTPHGQKIERNCVLPEYRNKGVAKKLLQHVISQLDRNYPIYLHAQVGVQLFYEKLNFVQQGHIFYEANIPHVLMVLK